MRTFDLKAHSFFWTQQEHSLSFLKTPNNLQWQWIFYLKNVLTEDWIFLGSTGKVSGMAVPTFKMEKLKYWCCHYQCSNQCSGSIRCIIKWQYQILKNQGNVRKSIYALFFSHILKGSVQLCIHISFCREHKRQRCALKWLFIFIHLQRAVLSQVLAQICAGVKSGPGEVSESFTIDVSGLEFFLLSSDTWIAAWTSAEVVSNSQSAVS